MHGQNQIKQVSYILSIAGRKPVHKKSVHVRVITVKIVGRVSVNQISLGKYLC